MRTNDYKFGQIVNPERFGLQRRPNEPIQFIEYDPEKGVPRIPGAPAVAIERKNVNEFGLADTVPNQIEIQRAAYGSTLAAAEYDSALSFADWCVEKRHEAPRALAVAEEIYRRAAGVITTDPTPRLGLARCYEAGFQFEQAFQEYRALLESTKSQLVMARLAELEARFRLFDQARALLEEAARGGRTDYRVQLAYGKFLAARGEYGAAIEHLKLANQFEPTAAEGKRERAGLRVALASALMSSGELAEAAQWVDKALQADPGDALAQAARLALVALGAGKPSPGDEGASDEGGFELLLARGIEKLGTRDAASAREAEDLLEQAAAVDPLRASLALRALSWLAETTNHPEQALHLVEAALEGDPLDPWALYQKGRLAAARDDLDGAQEAFARALEVELDFTDALVSMGELQHRRGEYQAAERYLERALLLEPKRADVLALRGLNQIQMGAWRDAEDSFRAARAVASDEPGARAGQAWCEYRRNDPTQAISSLRDLDDSRRALPATDPLRVWALAQIERIQDHVQKVAWTDHFERSSLMNGWEFDEKLGPQVAIHDGLVTLAGVFKKNSNPNNRARMYREIGASAFVSVEMRITVHADTNALVGLSVSRESQHGGEPQVEAMAEVVRHFDAGNTVQTRLWSRGHEDDPYVDVAGLEWKPDQPIVVRIERSGDASDTKIRILVDGFPVVEGKPMSQLGRGTNPLRLSLFAEGATGKKVTLDVDDVEVVYRESK